MINVSRVINSRNVAQPFTVYRKTGAWDRGRWVASESPISMRGVVTAASANDLQQVPEGDRVTGVMCFYSEKPIYTTHAGGRTGPDGTSDQIVWNGDRYRVASVMPWGDYGYNKALAVRMVGE